MTYAYMSNYISHYIYQEREIILKVYMPSFWKSFLHATFKTADQLKNVVVSVFPETKPELRTKQD
jgi:hypothetical protein